MSDDVERRLQLERDRLSQLETHQLPVMTAGEQTRLSWARKVESRTDLPAVYGSFMDDLLKTDRPFPYAVLTPTYAGFWHRETEKLIFCLDDRLWLIERRRNELNPRCYRLADIHYVELGTILLDGWLKFSGLIDGALATSRLRFNSVTDRLFTPFVERLRPAFTRREDWSLDAERDKFDYLMNLNFKFMNYARRSLMPGETVLCPVLQPEIRARLVSLFGHALHRTVSLAHIHILTDAEWIIIRDDEHSPVSHGHIRHGGVWTYVPLAKIQGVAVTARGDELLTVSIQLPEANEITAVFEAAKRIQIDQFLNQLRQIAPQVRVV